MLGQINDALKALSDEGVVITTLEAVSNLVLLTEPLKTKAIPCSLSKAVKTQGELPLIWPGRKTNLDGYKARKNPAGKRN